MIKNVFFDIGKVLIWWDPLDLALTFCPDRQTAELVSRATYLDPTWAELDKGTYSVAEVVAMGKARYPESLHPYLERAYEFSKFIPILPESVELVKKLSAEGYRLYFASNYCEKVYDVIKRLGIDDLFSGHLFSFEEKIVKPSPEFFRRLCDKYGLIPEECAFLDDMPANVAGAESIGIHGFVFEKNPDEAYRFIKSL